MLHAQSAYQHTTPTGHDESSRNQTNRAHPLPPLARSGPLDPSHHPTTDLVSSAQGSIHQRYRDRCSSGRSRHRGAPTDHLPRSQLANAVTSTTPVRIVPVEPIIQPQTVHNLTPRTRARERANVTAEEAAVHDLTPPSAADCCSATSQGAGGEAQRLRCHGPLPVGVQCGSQTPSS